jgi:hypothetical protein
MAERTPMTEPEIFAAIEALKADNEALRTEVGRCRSMLQEIGEANDVLRRQAEHALNVSERLNVDYQQAIAHVEDLKEQVEQQRGRP